MRNIGLNAKGETYSTSVTVKDKRMIDALLSKVKPIKLNTFERKFALGLWGRNDISYKQRDLLKKIFDKKI
tara:strand:+ start:411 stop:623 length:213 start_codon:yes stop_codon:yes gene_type:complete